MPRSRSPTMRRRAHRGGDGEGHHDRDRGEQVDGEDVADLGRRVRRWRARRSAADWGSRSSAWETCWTAATLPMLVMSPSSTTRDHHEEEAAEDRHRHPEVLGLEQLAQVGAADRRHPAPVDRARRSSQHPPLLEVERVRGCRARAPRRAAGAGLGRRGARRWSRRTAKYRSSRVGSWGTTRVRRTPSAARSADQVGDPGQVVELDLDHAGVVGRGHGQDAVAVARRGRGPPGPRRRAGPGWEASTGG